VVPPDSHGISRAPCYLGSHSGDAVVFVYRAVTFCGGPFACPSTNAALSYSLPRRQPRLNGPTTPPTQRLPAVTCRRFSLFRFRSPLLAESRLFSLPVGNEMFHFPTFPPHALCVQAWVTGHDSCRVSPFGHPRITARLAAPRGFSQPPTTFIGSWCQGIHRAPLLTWPQRCSRPLCSSQETGGPRPTPLRGRGSAAGRVLTVVLRRGLPLPQDPTACLGFVSIRHPRSRLRTAGTGRVARTLSRLVNVPPMSTTPARTSGRGSGHHDPRVEVPGAP